ncbi:MAG: cadherin domain-containing protein, partial [Aestuariivirga sp.]
MAEVQKISAEQATIGTGAVAALANGGYAYAWVQMQVIDVPDAIRIAYARIATYDATGDLVSAGTLYIRDFIQVDNYSISPMDVIGLDDGGYAVNFSVIAYAFVGPNLFNERDYFNSSGVHTAEVRDGDDFGVRVVTDSRDFAQCALTNGHSLVINTDFAADELAGFVYDSAGNAIGAPIDITAAPVLSKRNGDVRPEPAAVGLANGGFAVAWTDRSTLADGDNLGSAVKVRFFDASGTAVTGQILVNSSTVGDQRDASATRLPDGSVIIVWTDAGGNGGDAGIGIKGQRFSASGVPMGTEFIVNTTMDGDQRNATVTTLSNGAFVVVWEDRNPAGDDPDGCIRGQLFSTSGIKLGGEFLINTTTAGVQIDPDVAALADGRFVVLWSGDSHFYGYDGFGRPVVTYSGHKQIFSTDGFDFAPPSINGLSHSLASESAAIGTIVSTVQATDEHAIAHYSLVNDAGGRFAIDAATGQITVADGLLLDFEQASGFRVRVRVEDALGNVAERNLVIAVGDRTLETVLGDARDNRFVGGAGSDTFVGGAGNDVLNGGAGYDTLLGGLGNDRFYVDHAYDVPAELPGQGADTVFASISFALAANTEIEVLRAASPASTTPVQLTGNGYSNLILGNAGNNRIDGGGSADMMKGLGGNDLYFVDSAADKVFETDGGGTDTVVASVSFALGAGMFVERLQTNDPAAATAINLTGNELDNVIRGNAGQNVIRGNGGADIMYAGADAVRDTFVYASANDGGGFGSQDVIVQFDAANFAGDPNSDKIALHLIDADDDLAGNQAFRFVAAFTAPAPGG